MGTERYYCDNCGAECDPMPHPRGCGEFDCDQAARDDDRAAQEERREQAERDHYSRYEYY